MLPFIPQPSQLPRPFVTDKNKRKKKKNINSRYTSRIRANTNYTRWIFYKVVGIKKKILQNSVRLFFFYILSAGNNSDQTPKMDF